MKFKFSIFSMFLCSMIYGQNITKKALFLGNSYTEVNNLPMTVANAASSAGDNLIFESNSPGGYTFQSHSTDPNTLAKIAAGNWDYIILQEQSQRPSFPDAQVEVEVFPFAHRLDSLINAYNPCTETVFYMTWGRKNGDAVNCPYWPPVCTYEGMDDLLNLRYRMMAESNNAIVSPVGAVWRYIRKNYPTIELYQPDESHPSDAGTYIAACCFYTVLFRKDPTLITFNSTLSAIDAGNIRSAAKLIVYDSLMVWHVGEYDPSADFTYTNPQDTQITFTNKSLNASDYLWNFGDGDTSTTINPTHIYPGYGTYEATLFAEKCGIKDSILKTITITPQGIESQDKLKSLLNIYPNPAQDEINFTVRADLTGSAFVIFNNDGKAVLTGKIKSENTIVDLKDFPKGIYVLSIGEKIRQSFFVIKN